jgi:hypothetical protein
MRYSIVKKCRRSKRRCHKKHNKRTRRIKGGLGRNDSTNVNLNDTYSFHDQSLLVPFLMFTFGTPSQYVAWRRFLETCTRKNVPVYILTSGNKIGVVRTLQLANLADHFQEVLCTNPNKKPDGTPHPFPGNPHNITGQHNFGGLTKYQVIRAIMGERGMSCDLPIKGCLFDDSDHNRDAARLCPSIDFLLTKPGEYPPDYNEPAIRLNPFFKLCNASESVGGLELNRSLAKDKINFTPISMIDRATQLVDTDQYLIIFIDFDETFQIWPGALPFNGHRALAAFNANGYAIDQLPVPPAP